MLKRIVQCLAVVMLISVMWLVGYRDLSYAGYENIMPTDDSAVMLWLGYFAAGEFDMCDMLVANNKDKIYNVSAISVMSNREYYNLVYTRLRESISSFQLVETREHEDYIEYEVEVRYYAYDNISDLTYTGSKIKDYCEDFYNGENSNTNGFYAVLQSAYFDIFAESCFIPRNGAVELSKTYSFYQRNGKIFGTVSFIKDLLEKTYISENIEFYENNIQSYVERLIESY